MADNQDKKPVQAKKLGAEQKEKTADDEPQVDPNSPFFYLKVYSPYKLYFEGNIESVTAENLTGVFDILKGHKNFLTLLVPCELIIRSEKGEEKLNINRGIMHVKADRATVFLDV